MELLSILGVNLNYRSLQLNNLGDVLL